MKKIPQIYLVTLLTSVIFTLTPAMAGDSENADDSSLNTSDLVSTDLSALIPSNTNSAPNGNTILTDLVSIGNPGNDPDDQGIGSVDKIYQIGKYEVTAKQYASFLNAVAWKEDPHALYHVKMGSDQKVASIKRAILADGSYYYDVILGREKLPITYVSLNDAERFCNWLENGAPTSDQDYALLQESTEKGAYNFKKSNNQEVVEANPNALYHIPSDNEWVKAAYYEGNGVNAAYAIYPTQQGTSPNSGIGDIANAANYKTWSSRVERNFLSKDLMITAVDCFDTTSTFYEAHDMGGNVAEWTTSLNSEGLATVRGGSWKSVYSWYYNNDLMRTAAPKSYDPSIGTNFIGFRVVVASDQVVPQDCKPKIPSMDNGSTSSPSSITIDTEQDSFGWTLTHEDKLFIAATIIAASTLGESSLLFIGAELLMDYMSGMTWAEMVATFPKTRITMILSHLLFNSVAIAKTEEA